MPATDSPIGMPRMSPRVLEARVGIEPYRQAMSNPPEQPKIAILAATMCGQVWTSVVALVWGVSWGVFFDYEACKFPNDKSPNRQAKA